MGNLQVPVRRARSRRRALVLALLPALLALVPVSLARAAAPAAAVFLGAHPPVELLAHFEQVIVDADQVSDGEIAGLAAGGAAVLLRIDVGEIDGDRAWSRAADRAWALGENVGWRSTVMDPAQPGWRALVVERAAAQWQRGFRGVFLDGLEAWRRIPRLDAARREACERGLVELVRALHARLPEARVVLSRGFSLLPAVAPIISGVVAGPLFRGWDDITRRYREVPEDERRALLAELDRVTREHHLPVTVIDHVPAAEREAARKVAARIAALGYAPWVAPVGLDVLGVGAVEAIPRTILMVYDGAEAPTRAESAPHRLAVMPLEHLGYTVEYLDVRQDPLPEASLAGRYAGVVTWMSDEEMPRPDRYRRWLRRQVDDGMKLVVIGDFGFPSEGRLLARLGLSRVTAPLVDPVKQVAPSPLVGFEAPPLLKAREMNNFRAESKDIQVHVAVEDAQGERLALVATAPWGGFALDPFVISEGYQGRLRWVLDPFAFYRAALGPGPALVPDTTTENGRRLLTTHIDGDGFLNGAEMLGRPYAAQVIFDRILKVFPVPATVSVIEGEVGPAGLYPDKSPALEVLARQIFALPNVELASHSYSHPFDWEKATTEKGGKDIYHLAIPGYRYDARREVAGSVEYIDSRLAPPDKRVKVFLWSGEALGGEEAVGITREIGLLNVNGGNTQITRERDSLTEVAPMGLRIGSQFQVYAAIQNENIFTNLWHGPYYGFRTAMETFELTDRPRRLKPICIYYHFYSGAKVSSIQALEDVYHYGIERQESLPIRLSDFAHKVEEFQSVSLARLGDGGWQVRGARALRTLRIEPSLGWPDLGRSRGVVGVRDLPQGRYLALDGTGSAVVYFAPEPPRVPYLRQSNAQIEAWRPLGGGRVALRLRGALPVMASIGGARSCVVEGAQPGPQIVPGADGPELRWQAPDTGEVTIACR